MGSLGDKRCQPTLLMLPHRRRSLDLDHCAELGNQFDLVDRLGEKSLTARFEGFHPAVPIRAKRREKNHRDQAQVGIFLQDPADFVSIHLRHYNI